MNITERVMSIRTTEGSQNEYDAGWNDGIKHIQKMIKNNGAWGFEHEILAECKRWIDTFYIGIRTNGTVSPSFYWILDAYRRLLYFSEDFFYFKKDEAEEMLKTLRFILKQYDVTTCEKWGFRWR